MGKRRFGDGESFETTEIQQDPEVTMIELRIPLAQPTADGYESAYRAISAMTIHSLTPKQRTGLQWLYGGLRRRNVEFANGKPVSSQHDAIRYLLDLCGDHAERSPAA